MLSLVCCGVSTSGYVSNNGYTKEQQEGPLYTGVAILVTFNVNVHDGMWLPNTSYFYAIY